MIYDRLLPFVRLYKIPNLPMVPSVIVDRPSPQFAVERIKREDSPQPHVRCYVLTDCKLLDIISDPFIQTMRHAGSGHMGVVRVRKGVKVPRRNQTGEKHFNSEHPNSWKQKKRFARLQESPDADEVRGPSSVGQTPTNRLCRNNVQAGKDGCPPTPPMRPASPTYHRTEHHQ